MSNSLIYKLGRLNKYFKKDTSFNGKDFSSTSSCGDVCNITIKQTTPYIDKISFHHDGCILSKAVVNAILLEIDKKTKEQAINIVSNFIDMSNNVKKKYSLDEQLLLFKKFNKFPSRKSCMTIGAKAILAILHEV